MSSNLVVLLFLLQSFEGIFAGTVSSSNRGISRLFSPIEDAAHAVFSDSYIKAVVKSVQAIHPNATNVSVVANDCSEGSLFLTAIRLFAVSRARLCMHLPQSKRKTPFISHLNAFWDHRLVRRCRLSHSNTRPSSSGWGTRSRAN